MSENKKIKVVIGINSFCIGGAEMLLLKQFKYFDKEKFEFYLISLFELKNKTTLFDLVPDYINVFRFDFKSIFDFKNIFELFRLLKKIKPNIIISNLFFSNTIFRIFGIILRIKTIIVEHNTYINKIKFHQFIDRILSYFTYKIIAVSDEVANFTSKQEKININKFKVIYNGIDLDEIEKFKENNKDKIIELKEKLGFENSDKIVINIARLTNQKRIDLLINVFSKLNKLDEKYKLIVLGEGELMENLKNQVKFLHLENYVFLLGAKKNIYEYYMISDLFVLTSKIEGFALVCIEAMTFEIPVISTKVAGPDKYIKDYFNGFLTEHNEDDIFNKILLFFDLNSQELEKYKKNCLDTAKQFDIKNNIKEYEKLFYESLKT